MNAAFMSSQPHESGIHAVRPGAGEARGAEVRFRCAEPVPSRPGQALLDALALAATVGLHLWRRNAVLSILGGTAIHVILATALPVH